MYKKLIITLIFCTPFIGQSQEIEIEFQKNIPWSEVLDLAKSQNKYIFVDAYTDWCSWCKVMDKKTFTDSHVKSMLDVNFIPVKIDAEKNEGIEFAAKFKIQGYPTSIFLSPEGMLIKKQPGYLDATEFRNTCVEVLNDRKESKFSGINLNPGFPDFYINSYNPEIKERPSNEQVYAFLDQREDLMDEVSWAIMFNFSLNEKYETLFLSRKDEYSDLYGEDEIFSKIKNIAYKKLQLAIKNKNKEELQETLDFVRTYYSPEEANTTFVNMEITYFQNVGEWMKFAELVNPIVRTLSPNRINGYCWDIYEKCNDMAVVDMACEWMQFATDKNQDYALLDTYAAVLYKANKTKEADDMATKAIKKGKEQGENIEETEKLLELIRKVK